MSWVLTGLKMIGSLLGLSDLIAGFFHDRQVRQGQKDADYADQNRHAVQEIDQAAAARSAAERDIADDPGGVRPDTNARRYDPDAVG